MGQKLPARSFRAGSLRDGSTCEDTPGTAAVVHVTASSNRPSTASRSPWLTVLEKPEFSGTATLTVASVKSLGGNAMVTARSEIVDGTGAHVVTATSTLVVRGEDA